MYLNIVDVLDYLNIFFLNSEILFELFRVDFFKIGSSF